VGFLDVTLRGLKGSRTLRMLVDTGSTYIVVEPGVVGELGFIRTPYTARLVLAGGRVVDANVYVGEAEVMGRRGPVLVVGYETPVPLLGVYALETLGFKG
jgi:predicted aspartyl protease